MSVKYYQRPHLLWIILPSLFQTGCSENSQLAWLKGLGSSIFFGGFKWAALAGILGLFVGILCFLILRRWKKDASSHVLSGRIYSRIVGLIAVIAFLVILPLCVAYIGFLEGVLRASTYQLSEGEFAQEYFPVIGHAGADLVGVTLLADRSGGSASQDLAALKAEFRSGAREIDAAQIPAMIAAIDGAFVREVSDDIKDDIQRTVPALNSGRGKQALDWFMDNFSDALIRAAIQQDFEDKGLGSVLDLFGAMIRQLPEAAARDGHPETLSHAETSTFLVETAIGDGLIKFVIRPFCRAHQIGVLLPALLALCVPFVLKSGWLARAMVRLAEIVGLKADPSRSGM